MRVRIVHLVDLTARQLELPSGVRGARSPAWCPDGTRMAFVGTAAPEPQTGQNDIYLMNLSDGETTNLTNGSVPFIAMPAWSPDGKEIAFVSDRGGDMAVYRMAADGSTVTRVTDSSGADVEPAWSPDGGKICFVSDRKVPAWERVVRWVQWRWRE